MRFLCHKEILFKTSVSCIVVNKLSLYKVQCLGDVINEIQYDIERSLCDYLWNKETRFVEHVVSITLKIDINIFKSQTFLSRSRFI